MKVPTTFTRSPLNLALLLIACVIGIVFMRPYENFVVSPSATSRCGVQLGGCETPGTRCMNGYCAPTAKPKMPAISGPIVGDYIALY